MRFGVVYKYTCPRCPRGGSYIGSTLALLRTRAASHMGISHRTLNPLNVKKYSAIRCHSEICHYKPEFKDFKIMDSCNRDVYLRILESIYIKKLNPELNSDLSSYPLLII